MKNAIFAAVTAAIFAACSPVHDRPEYLTRADLDTLRAEIAAQIAASNAAVIDETRRAAAAIRNAQTAAQPAALRSVHDGPDAGTVHPDSAPVSNNPPTVYEPGAAAENTRVCPDKYITRDGDEYPVHQGTRGGCYYITNTGAKRYLKK